MNIYGHKNKGQATTELAILGSIILLILGAMIRYSQTMSASQRMQMYAFGEAARMAMSRANNDKMGRVSFTAVQDIYPVDITGFRPISTNVSGSATVLYDPEMTFYDGTDREDYGKNYIQVGRDMMARNEIIEFPQMHTRRRYDERGSASWWERIFDTLFGSDAPSEIEVWESVPVETTVQVSGPRNVNLEPYLSGNLPVASSLANTPMEIATATRTEQPQGISGTRITQRNEKNMQRYYLKSNSEILSDDPDVIAVLSRPGDDLTITTEKTATKQRQWFTPR